MTRVMLTAAAILAGLSGCATPARYVERTPDSGVVAIPANSDVFPTYYQTEAMSLIRKHVGSNFEILDEREFDVAQRTQNEQKTRDDFFDNQHVQNTTTTYPVKEWRIAYRKKAKVGDSSVKKETGPISPAGGAAPIGNVQPAGGIVPPVGPLSPVVPAGGPNTTGSNTGSGISGSVGTFIGTQK